MLLTLYLVLGWIFIGIVSLQGDAIGAMLSGGVASLARTVSETGAIVSALSPGTPMIAALVSSVLLVDVALVAVLLFFVRRRLRS